MFPPYEFHVPSWRCKMLLGWVMDFVCATCC